MTVKELEEALGMTRANIRFYEQEGLLSPARNPNGYRDYSREDMETLKKIKLLRGLHVDLETIRALQRGEQSLSAALERKMRELEADEAALAGARTVCAQLRQETPDYASLDAGPWLARLETAPSSERFAPPRDEKPLPRDPFVHPWRRFFARSLDLALYGLVIMAVLLLGFHVPVETMTGRLVRIVVGWLANLPMLLLEPLMLSCWGTTPGKAVFGITVLDGEGQKMSLGQARERTMTVFAKGMGYGIPIYGMWREYKSWKDCENREWHDWEICSYTGEPEQMIVPDQDWRCGAFVGVRALMYALALLIVLQSLMPPCRGDLELGAFCRNVNFYQSYLSLGGVDFTGQGVRQDWGSETGVIVIELLPTVYDETWSPVEENGETVGFRYTLHAEGGFFNWDVSAQQAGLLAFVGSLPETNCVSLARDGWLFLLRDQPWQFDLVHQGVHLTRTMEVRGGSLGDQVSGWIFAGEDGTPVTVDLEFTISRQ